jgi:thiosulfate/3-mercaptopyruvate sulfurtransferase
MPEPTPPLVTTDWVEAHLRDPAVRVADIRGYVTTRQVEPGVEEATYRGAPDEYLAGHIPGAVYLDWTKDIIDPADPGASATAPTSWPSITWAASSPLGCGGR